MNLSRYLLGGLVVAVLGATLVYALTPSTITGDREADAACAALAEWIGTDKTELGSETAARLTGPQRGEMIAEITGHTEKSSLQSIRTAGEQLAKTSAEQGLLAPLSVMVGVLGVAASCKAEGWTPQKAGLVVDGAK